MQHGIKKKKKAEQQLANKLGYSKVSDSKLAVAKKIKEYVFSGGFYLLCVLPRIAMI